MLSIVIDVNNINMSKTLSLCYRSMREKEGNGKRKAITGKVKESNFSGFLTVFVYKGRSIFKILTIIFDNITTVLKKKW